MKTILAFLVVFVCIGVFAKKFDNKARLLLILATVSLVAYLTIK